MLGDQKKVETTNLATVVAGLSLGQCFGTAPGLVISLWNISVAAQWGRVGAGKLNPAGQGGRPLPGSALKAGRGRKSQLGWNSFFCGIPEGN